MDNDKIKEQVQQIKELTNRTEDEILVILYDANYDTEQAINMLLERDETESKSVSTSIHRFVPFCKFCNCDCLHNRKESVVMNSVVNCR